MATVYKRSRRKPMPEGAEITTRKGKKTAVWTNRKTRRKQRAELSDDGEAVLIVAKHYTVEWFDHTGKRPKVNGGPDKDAAEALGAKMEAETMQRRRGLIDPRQEQLAGEGRRPIAEHLEDYRSYRNVADFHATRHTCVSGIVAGGASVKTAQELSRHPTPNPTIGRYSHTRLMDLQGALEGLPDLNPDKPDAQQQDAELRATGTDDAQAESRVGCCSPKSQRQQSGQQLDGEKGQKVASGGESADETPDAADNAQTVILSVFGAKKDATANRGDKRRRPDSNRGWRICNPLP